MKTVLVTVFLPAALLAAAAGCSNTNVDVSATDEGVHQDLVKEDEGGRTVAWSRPRVVGLPPPAYPDPAPEPGLVGLIMVRVLVGTNGEAIEAAVSQPLHPDLDQAALAAALAGTYLPAMEGEIPREDWISVPFRYPPEGTEGR